MRSFCLLLVTPSKFQLYTLGRSRRKISRSASSPSIVAPILTSENRRWFHRRSMAVDMKLLGR